MNQATAEELAKKAAQEAVCGLLKEQRRLSEKRVFKNTKKLMENYKRIKANVEDGVSQAANLEETQAFEYEYIDELFVESVQRSKFRSALMIAHIDKCLELLKREQERKNKVEKYYVFMYFYIDEMSYESIAEIYGLDERTCRRWVNEMLNILKIYLFGIDALGVESL